MDIARLSGYMFGTIIVWWCIFYTMVYMIKQEDKEYKICALGIFLFLINMSGMYSIFLALCVYVVSKYDTKNTNISKIDVIKTNKIYFIGLIIIYCLSALLYIIQIN